VPTANGPPTEGETVKEAGAAVGEGCVTLSQPDPLPYATESESPERLWLCPPVFVTFTVCGVGFKPP
jgi:hypothetical protein